DYLFHALTGFGPLELLIQRVSAGALPLYQLQQELFPEGEQADRATDALLALATYARRMSDQRVLLPTRMHMFFRGLPRLSQARTRDRWNCRATSHSITGPLRMRSTNV